MVKKFIVVCSLIMFLVGCANTETITLPLEEKDVSQLMAEKMDIAGWNFSRKDDTYSFRSVPSDPNAEGVTLDVNAKTGTVYERTSGLPQTNLVRKDAPNFLQVTNGEIFKSEINKMAKQVLDKNGLTPDNDNWISGGYGEGFIYGDVKKDGKKITIKLDIFTEEWEEIDNPF
ncbi:hypothetical protein BRE01_36860 [Brevibacillus reuszeri]|uniref:Lipoprotein n=1 Tax=Brevibacillus reuszeri TaxID=54915 RepID=A0A0K9YPI4_9BACL|nr:hypothetical protein [Brevibacillus reuszeri]KNB70586.1 hypothetical protein ADS79_16905 [Brevibacillus reuszeri]MED1861439.1 hypothetical protein [Brevibacillus reuszeri]GED69984.1 hypothetical protein BRE01_36860 [Brevibacillus reuszeri]